MRTSLVLLSLLLCGLLIAGCTSTTTNGTTSVATASTPTTQVTNTNTSTSPPQQNRVDRGGTSDPAGPLPPTIASPAKKRDASAAGAGDRDEICRPG